MVSLLLRVVQVFVRLVDQNRLEGIIYIYFPLAKISELANSGVILLFISAFIFLVVVSYLIYKGIRHIMRPLNRASRASNASSPSNSGCPSSASRPSTTQRLTRMS